jgi:glycerol-3-phosphate acyltransferase PlsX
MKESTVAVDVMGGDYAPEEVVKGAIEATQAFDVKVILVGKQDCIEKILKKYPISDLPIQVHHASEVVNMNDVSLEAIRRKKDSSIKVALNLVKSGKAHAVYSAGNSSITLAAAMFILGRLPQVERPALAGIIPTLNGRIVLIDVGGIVDCHPFHLVQFAIMGHVFAKYILNTENPRLGILNIGEETIKGNDLVKKTFTFLQKRPLNFIGNIEGGNVLQGKADVVICDGFVGNVALKFGEGMAEAFLTLIKQEVKKSFLARIGVILVKRSLKNVFKRWDYSEHGGAPLLGVNGIVIVGHGCSKAKAIKNGIRMADQFITQKINLHLEKGLKEYEAPMLGKRWYKLAEKIKEIVS